MIQINKIKLLYENDLPKNKKDNIDWRKLINKNLYFRYNDNTITLLIQDVYLKNDKLFIKFSYNNEIFDYCAYDVKNGRITKIFKIKLNEMISKTNYEIDYVKNFNELNFNKKFIDILTYGSDIKIFIKCKTCGQSRQTPIRCADIFKNKKAPECAFCGNTNSYAERFVSNLLKNIGVPFGKKTFSWAINKQYDFYIPSLNCIIETHGLQHYSNITNFSNIGGRTLFEEQENDRLKEQLAKENGIEHYIVIDCRHSEPELIKSNILNSELSNLLDLSKVDWLKVFNISEKSLILDVCKKWENTPDNLKSTVCFAKKYNTTDVQIRRYLKRGCKIGLCNYDVKLLRKNAGHKANLSGQKYKYICSLNNEEKEFNFVSEIILYYNATSKIIRNLINTNKPYKEAFNKSQYNLTHLVGLLVKRVEYND